MLLAELVAAAAAVAATSSRTAKIDLLAGALRAAAPGEIDAAVGFLVGRPRQGRIGVGWATAYRLDAAPSPSPSLSVRDLDDAIDRIQALTGDGSVKARGAILGGLLGRATDAEQDFIRRVFTGELRQGALEGVVTDAVAKAAEVPAATVRRAAMLSGDLGAAARIAFAEGRAGLERVGLTLLRPVLPMLASTAETVHEALAFGGPASVEWKLDGIRIQAHRAGDDVRVFSRNGNDLTDRLSAIAAAVRDLPVRAVVLDGEALGDVPYFFDALHLDGRDLLDRPLSERIEALESAASRWRVAATVTDDPDAAEAFLGNAIAAGHEGLVVKDLASAYQAGRRGKAWRKVKPAKTFDLVVLAAEWGHGRRRGRLSNIHLGALDASGSPVMVGKTFKGMTDSLLSWQTERLLSLKEREEGITVWVRPELVAEIELEGVQESTRYPGGIVLRFARLVRYRDDKGPAEADTLESLRALLERPEPTWDT